MTTPRLGEVDNAPYQSAFNWRVADHPTALARARSTLAAEGQPQSVRALAAHTTEEPAIALLDCWAVVADVVSFYTERVANEGFLRTATELRSVRELARTLGHELHPGVAAQVDLAFTVDEGHPAEVTVARGTAVQSLPRPGQLPQTFDTSEELRARAVWNEIAGSARVLQTVTPAASIVLWLSGTGHRIALGAPILVRDGTYRVAWTARAVDESPEGHLGWTRLVIAAPDGQHLPDTFSDDVEFVGTTGRSFVFGWNAPDRRLIQFPTATHDPGAGDQPAQADQDWPAFGIMSRGALELDGEHPDIVAGSWIVVIGRKEPADPVTALPLQVLSCTVGNAAAYTLSGPVTRLGFESDAVTALADTFGRRETVVHFASQVLSTRWRPRTAPVGGDEDNVLVLAATEPVLPPRRPVVVSGVTTEGIATVLKAEVVSCSAAVNGEMVVHLDQPLPRLDPRTVRVQANISRASHGETVQEVLGGGDGRLPFAQFPTRRAPLTFVRAATPTGVRTSLEVWVDGVAWAEVESLSAAAGDDRVFTVRRSQDGAARVQFGDGIHGARVPSGVENVTASYRVGIGADGAADTGQINVLVQRPFGLARVSNPMPSSDWAAPEPLEMARRNAPGRVRTLDRAVSVVDHQDFAGGFAGVDAAAAAVVWNGRQDLLVISLVGAGGGAVSAGLLSDLATALGEVREDAMPLLLLPAVAVPFTVGVQVRYDPAFLQPAVDDAIRRALLDTFGPGRWPIATALTSARVLVMVLAVPGVIATAMPVLTATSAGAVGANRLDATPARWDQDTVLAAEVLVLDTIAGAVTIEQMP